MKKRSVRIPQEQIEAIDAYVDDSPRFADRSEFIRASIAEMLEDSDD